MERDKLICYLVGSVGNLYPGHGWELRLLYINEMFKLCGLPPCTTLEVQVIRDILTDVEQYLVVGNRKMRRIAEKQWADQYDR